MRIGAEKPTTIYEHTNPPQGCLGLKRGLNGCHCRNPDGRDPFDVIELNKAVARMAKLHGKDWQTYQEAAAELGIGGTTKAGAADAVASIGRTAATATEVYTTVGGDIGTAGLATAPIAATKAERAAESGLTTLTKKFGASSVSKTEKAGVTAAEKTTVEAAEAGGKTFDQARREAFQNAGRIFDDVRDFQPWFGRCRGLDIRNYGINQESDIRSCHQLT